MTENQTALMQLAAEYRQAAADIKDQRHQLDEADSPETDHCKRHSALSFALSRGLEKLLDGRAVELEIARENQAETQRTIRDAAIAWLPALAGGGGLLAGIGALIKGFIQ